MTVNSESLHAFEDGMLIQYTSEELQWVHVLIEDSEGMPNFKGSVEQ